MKQRLTYVDMLNVAACAGVLLLHSTNGPVHHFDGNVDGGWFTGLFTHSFFLWPVDVFFMLSGVTMMETCRELTGGKIRQFYLRRLRRLGFPLLAWSLFYAAMKVAKDALVDGEPVDMARLLTDVLTFKVNGDMWFFFPLVVIYISMPFLSLFAVSAGKKVLDWYMLFGLVLPDISRALYPESLASSYFVFGTPYTYFVVAGYYIGTYGMTGRVRKALYAASACSAVFMFVSTCWLTLHCPEHYGTFLSYVSLPCTLTALGVFAFFRHVDWDAVLRRFRLTAHGAALFSSYSLGIYLVQRCWFTFLSYFHLCDGLPLVRFCVMYALCLASVHVMKRVPVVKRMVP